jgi:uncharacterized membrane protein YebE (DUF533 family)
MADNSSRRWKTLITNPGRYARLALAGKAYRRWKAHKHVVVDDVRLSLAGKASQKKMVNFDFNPKQRCYEVH